MWTQNTYWLTELGFLESSSMFILCQLCFGSSCFQERVTSVAVLRGKLQNASEVMLQFWPLLKDPSVELFVVW